MRAGHTGMSYGVIQRILSNQCACGDESLMMAWAQGYRAGLSCGVCARLQVFWTGGSVHSGRTGAIDIMHHAKDVMLLYGRGWTFMKAVSRFARKKAAMALVQGSLQYLLLYFLPSAAGALYLGQSLRDHVDGTRIAL